jgi:hypothetical protein
MVIAAVGTACVPETMLASVIVPAWHSPPGIGWESCRENQCRI